VKKDSIQNILSIILAGNSFSQSGLINAQHPPPNWLKYETLQAPALKIQKSADRFFFYTIVCNSLAIIIR